MASDKPALVLFHAIGMSGGNAWQEVAPLLSDDHQVYVPTALGHRGGPPAQQRPVTIDDAVDAAERYLDEHGLERPHLAGNSMGGYIAVCASPCATLREMRIASRRTGLLRCLTISWPAP